MSYLLVIGSAHIDAVAVTGEALNDSRPDVEGRVSFSLGGTAFNIAKNLAQHGLKVDLLTSLKEHSITADLVIQQCRKLNIRINSPILQEESEGGFAGHYAGVNVFKAICEAAIERVNLLRFKEALNGAIRHASTIVVDTNLQAEQLEQVLSIAHTKNLPVLVAGVSVSRVRRIQQAVNNIRIGASTTQTRANHLIDVLSINLSEAEALGIIECPNTFTQNPISDIYENRIDELSVRRLVVSCGAEGYYIFDFSQPGQVPVVHKRVNINPAEVKSDNGAGDALIAAIAASHREDFGVWENNIQKYVAPVLKVVSATTEDEFGLDRSTYQNTDWSPWTPLVIALLSLVTIPIVGKLGTIYGNIEGKDLAFALVIILGLFAGGAGGIARDLVVKMGYIDSKHCVATSFAIIPSLSGLVTLILFLALPHFANGVTSTQLTVPGNIGALLWFAVAFLGGFYADLVVSQDREIKHLKKLVKIDY